MKITQINKNKNNVTIYFGKEKLVLFPNVFASYNLYLNKIIDDSTLENIKKDNKTEEYFIYIVKKLALKSYSPNKIKDFLYKKGATKKQISTVLEKLRKFDFINEKEMVEEIISYCDAKHYGYNKIIKMANDRFISKEEISLIKYNLNREQKEAIFQIKLIENRFKNKNEFSKKKAMYVALVRYGFDESLSLELVNKCSNSNRAHEINVLKLDYAKCFQRYSRKYTGLELNQKIIESLLSKGYRLADINYLKERDL